MHHVFVISIVVLCGLTDNLWSQEAQVTAVNASSSSVSKFRQAASKYLGEKRPLEIQFRCNLRSFGHLSRPWETTPSEQFGEFAFGGTLAQLHETDQRGERTAESQISYSANFLYQLDSSGRAWEQPVRNSLFATRVARVAKSDNM